MVDRCLSFCPFSFGLRVVCPSIYGFLLPLWFLETLLVSYCIIDYTLHWKHVFNISLAFLIWDLKFILHWVYLSSQTVFDRLMFLLYTFIDQYIVFLVSVSWWVTVRICNRITVCRRHREHHQNLFRQLGGGLAIFDFES